MLLLGKDGAAMISKTLYTVIVADDEDELREAVCSMICLLYTSDAADD